MPAAACLIWEQVQGNAGDQVMQRLMGGRLCRET